MENKLKRLNLIVGLVLFLFDFGSDIYVAAQYLKNGEIWWFSLTFVFISIPSIIVNITAIIQVINFWRFIAAMLQLSVVVHYIEAIKLPDSHRIYSIAKLRYLETVMESAPQWCLQMYIMLRQWSFPSLTIVSSILSFLSLVWSIKTLEKERAEAEGGDFGLFKAFMFMMWHMFTLISRFSAIVLVGYMFRYPVFFLAGHWLLMVFYNVSFRRLDVDANFPKLLFLSLLTTYPSLFHSISLKGIFANKNPKLEMIVAYISIVAENILMMASIFLIKHSDAEHLAVAITVYPLILGTMISYFFFLFVVFSVSNR